MSEVTLPQKVSRISSLQIAIAILAVVTGLIHLNRALGMNDRKDHPQPFSPRMVSSGAKAKRSDLF